MGFLGPPWRSPFNLLIIKQPVLSQIHFKVYILPLIYLQKYLLSERKGQYERGNIYLPQFCRELTTPSPNIGKCLVC